MVSLRMVRMPSAASSTEMPSGFAIFVSIAARARSARIGMRPLSRRLGIETAEQHVGVGDRRLLAAARIANRPWVGACAARPNLQEAAIVDPRDAAAAGADRVDVDHRKAYRIARNLTLARDERCRFLDQADIGRGAADIEGDQIAVPGAAAEVAPRRSRPRRARRPVCRSDDVRLHAAKQSPRSIAGYSASRQGRDCSRASRAGRDSGSSPGRARHSALSYWCVRTREIRPAPHAKRR